jgi:hypothetical protein
MNPIYGLSFKHLLCGISLLFIAACGGNDGRLPMARVTGTVLYQGGPVAGVMVTFQHPAAPRISSGTTDQMGEFELMTFASGDGAFVGENAVAIEAVVADPGMEELSELAKQTKAQRESTDLAEREKAIREFNRKAAEISDRITKKNKSKKKNAKDDPDALIPLKYARASSSGVVRTVEAGKSNNFEIILND